VPAADATTIERCTSGAHAGWLALRTALWPQCPQAEHVDEMAAMAREPQRHVVLVARAADGSAVGLVEATLRHDYVNGTTTSPVAFVEGLYVVPMARRRGIARRLVDGVIDWARSRGSREVASDALIDNVASHRMHVALGFCETERVVFFRRAIGDAGDDERLPGEAL
jgi:aminoglycoside 6'-N-acetyltransferase I